MLESIVQQLERYLHQEGHVADILLKSEQSVYDTGEQHEIQLQFVKSEQADNPVVSIHLFPVDEHTYEVEVDALMQDDEQKPRDLANLWEQISQFVEGATIAENRRYLGPAKLLKTEWTVNYFFLINLDESDEETVQQMLANCASVAGKLARL